MYPHYFKIQKPKPKWQRKLETINPYAVNTISIGLITIYFIVCAIL